MMSLYDLCTWNIDVDQKQLEMLFHVDNITLAHTESNIVTKHTKMMYKTYGTKELLVVTRGKMHEHLGTTFNFGLNMVVGITQCDFI